jgi:hypothetical protein
MGILDIVGSLHNYFSTKIFPQHNELNIKATTIPALAKSTLAWPAFFNLVGNKDIRDMMNGKLRKIMIEEGFNQVTVS